MADLSYLKLYWMLIDLPYLHQHHHQYQQQLHQQWLHQQWRLHHCLYQKLMQLQQQIQALRLQQYHPQLLNQLKHQQCPLLYNFMSNHLNFEYFHHHILKHLSYIHLHKQSHIQLLLNSIHIHSYKNRFDYSDD